MSGLTNTIEITRAGRTLISKLMKGAATGISHVAVGSGVGGAYSAFGTNSRVGNNLEITGVNPVVVHNDFPVYNFGPNGSVNAFYFIEQANPQADLSLAFGPDALGANILQQNHFNHLWLVHSGTSGSYGIGKVLNVATGNALIPAAPADAIAYIGYVEADQTVKTVFNPSRLYNELGRTTSMTIDYLGDRAIGVSGLEFLQPNLVNTSTEPNPSLLIRAPFSLGVTNTIREIAIIGNNGTDILAWAPLAPGTPITTGQGIFIRWALGF